MRYADFNGYLYDRNDVTALGLANAYAQTLGTIFTESNKPYEVEIVVAEVGPTPDRDQMYRITFDGFVADERQYVAKAVRPSSSRRRCLAGRRARPRGERSEILRRAFELMKARQEQLATLIVLENGKALSDARGEVAYAAEFFRWYAEEAVRESPETAESRHRSEPPNCHAAAADRGGAAGDSLEFSGRNGDP